MKKFISVLLVAVMTAALLTGCGKDSSSNQVVVYNWGEYIDPDVITMFEEETGIKVVYEEFETNEIMYPKVEAGASQYDVLCPSDYMISKLIENEDPLKIVNEQVIPALDIVGKGFEEKTVFLPQLLISAEAAQSSFEEIKSVMPAMQHKTGKKIVIATVHGDIHDIGKNIVKLLLENYGYDVIDLGKDVPEEDIVNKVIEEKAEYVGLSALMTTTLPAMERPIALLKEKAPNVKIVTGGAVLNEEYAKKIGSNKYAKDAMDIVRFLEE